MYEYKILVFFSYFSFYFIKDWSKTSIHYNLYRIRISHAWKAAVAGWLLIIFLTPQQQLLRTAKISFSGHFVQIPL